MTTTPTPIFFSSLLQAADYYGDRELCFQRGHDGAWALADNSNWALIDALTEAGGVLVFNDCDRELPEKFEKEPTRWHAYLREQHYEFELHQLELRREEEDRFRYLDGDHHPEERGELLPEHYHPDTL